MTSDQSGWNSRVAGLPVCLADQSRYLTFVPFGVLLPLTFVPFGVLLTPTLCTVQSLLLFIFVLFVVLLVLNKTFIPP